MVEVHHLEEVRWALVEIWHTMRHHWVLIETRFELLGHFGLEVAFAFRMVLMSVFFWCLLLFLLPGSLLLVLLTFLIVSHVESSVFVLALFTLSLVFVIRADVTNSRLVSSVALSLVSIKSLLLLWKQRGDSLLLLLDILWGFKEEVLAVMWLLSCLVGDVHQIFLFIFAEVWGLSISVVLL